MNLKKYAILLSLLSVILAYTFNEINLAAMRKEGIALRKDQTVETNDDSSYLHFIENYIRFGSPYLSERELYSSIMRTPGYGLTYLMMAQIVGLSHALFYQKMLQLLLFGLSIYCLVFIAFALLKNKRWAIAVTAIYALLPFSMGFLYYTLTEGITPALLIFYAYFLMMTTTTNLPKRKAMLYFMASLVFAYLLLTRPVLGFMGLAFPFFLWRDYFSRKRPMIVIAAISGFGVVCISLLLGWQLRNYTLTGRYTEVQPVYQNENPGTFRKPHHAIWGLYKAWESKGSHFHETLVPLWERAIAGDTAMIHVQKVLEQTPTKAVEYFGKARLVDAFRMYQKASLAQRSYYDQSRIMPHQPLPIEDSVAQLFNEMASEYRKQFPLEYHLITPLKVFKNLVFHSNLSLYVFQHSWRGVVLMELLRWICFIIHASAFILCFLIVLIKTNIRYKALFGISIILYIFYLTYFQRGIEERYTLPILAFAILGAAFVLKQLLERFSKKSHNQG